MMRTLLAALALVSTSPTHAADRYSGTYAAGCGTYVCELRIAPDGVDRWHVRWSATDPTDHRLRPVCALKTTAAIGAARMGPVGVVTGIAVGTVKGQPFGLFDLGGGRVSWSSSWEACRGVRPKGIYASFGDE